MPVMFLTASIVSSSIKRKIKQACPQSNNSYVVSTSQIIDPAGKTVTFPGRPVDLALNTTETILAVKT